MQETQGFTQGLRKQHKVQNTPLISCKPYHVTNSSHVIGNFLRTLRSLCKPCVACVACITYVVLRV